MSTLPSNLPDGSFIDIRQESKPESIYKREISLIHIKWRLSLRGGDQYVIIKMKTSIQN